MTTRRDNTPIYDALQRQRGCGARLIGTYGFAANAKAYDDDRCHLPPGHADMHDNYQRTRWGA